MRLSIAIAQYLELKQSLGSRFHAEAVILKSFCKFMQNGEMERIGPERVLIYLQGAGSLTRFWHRKHEVLSGFYRFAIGRGYASCNPLPLERPKLDHSFKPYVFSTSEIRRLLNATEQLTNPRSKVTSKTFRTILFLLYGSGLRIGEALSLRVQDVDLESGLLHIEQSKFYKSRLVPIGPRLKEVLAAYGEQHDHKRIIHEADRPFFVTRLGEPVRLAQTERAFSRIRLLAGIHRHDGGRYQPRLHDLRHAFAVHRLEAWYREGADVQRLLPQLSTYLGHVNVSATQHYLTMTPELLREASLRFARYAWPQEGQDE
jgi:site-specific recombinase XerD